MNKGVKHDQGKPDLTLLLKDALFEMARVREFGNKKYSGVDTWRGVGQKRYLAAALRHIYQYQDNPKDSESGLSHLGHALVSLMFAYHFEVENEKNNLSQPKP